MSVATQLYIIGGINILLPVIALVILRRLHTYRISSIICGIGSYFIAANFLMGLVGMILSEIGITSEFWNDNPIASIITQGALSAVLQSFILFIVLRFVLKGNVKIYDAMALGTSYWLYNALTFSYGSISYARAVQMSAQGRLAEMVTESTPIEIWERAISDVETLGIGSFYTTTFNIFVLMCASAALTLFLFLALKRRDKRYLFITMGATFVMLMVMNLAQHFAGSTGFIIANFIVLIASIITLVKFMQWYRAQQEALRERRREYREYIKENN